MMTQERLKELMRYDAGTGDLIRVVKMKQVEAGGIAGWVENNGYRRVCIDGRRYLAHRVAWLYVHGKWPEHEIDHINGVRDDNRIANLRSATHAENAQNRGKRPDNSSGLQGVSWHVWHKKWAANIRVHQKLRHLGYFDTPEAAHAAYLAAKAELHTFQPTLRKEVKDGHRETPGFLVRRVEVV